MMRRQRSIFDMFPETVDLNQGPSFNGLDVTESDECNSRLSSSERRLLSNDISGEINKPQSFNSWDVGESSSRPNVQNNVVYNNNNNRSTSFGIHDSRFRERSFDHQRVVGPLNLQNSGFTHAPMDVDLNLEYKGNSSNDGVDGSADLESSSSGTSNERGSSSSFGNQGQPLPNNGYVDQRSINSTPRSTQQLNLMHIVGMPRNLLPFPMSGNANSRNGSSSSSGFSQNNRRSSINGGNGQSSTRNDTVRIPNLNSTSNDHQRSDSPPWTLFPYLDTESRGHRSQFRNFPSGPSFSSDENVPSSASRNPPRHHQPNLRLELPDDRLVSELLNVIRRGEHFTAEDYMFDPFMNGFAELHDRHRDMRLDVDNMSYEELLALEERIGDVKTGLTEEDVSNSLKQRKYFSFMAMATQHSEPCCICQEEYKNGDDIGFLECGHEFHIDCIKQWLTHKNLCPICKMTGLST